MEPMRQFQSVWVQSRGLNEQWLNLLVRLEENLAKLTPVDTVDIVEKLQLLWRQALDANLALDAEIAGGASFVANQERERIELLEQIRDRQKTLLPRLSTIKAVAAAELRQVVQGRQALSGYGSFRSNKTAKRLDKRG